MRIVARYDFNNGLAAVTNNYSDLYQEIVDAVSSVDADSCRTKRSREKTKTGKILYHPASMNRAFKDYLSKKEWTHSKILCDYPTEYYINGYQPEITRGAFRDMDFVKNRLGIEVQFGKYAFMVYNVCAKMTIFHKMGIIDVGVEIVPVKRLANEMSTGVSYFEQFAWDLTHRGISNIDIPVLILGIDV